MTLLWIKLKTLSPKLKGMLWEHIHTYIPVSNGFAARAFGGAKFTANRAILCTDGNQFPVEPPGGGSADIEVLSGGVFEEVEETDGEEEESGYQASEDREIQWKANLMHLICKETTPFS